MYFGKGLPKKAFQDFDLAIMLNPNYGATYYQRGKIYLELRRFGRAESDWKKALALGLEDIHIQAIRHSPLGSRLARYLPKKN